MNKTRWQQIEDLYNAALDKPLAERTQFLSDECAGDAELFNEVESLLSSSDASGSFLAKPEFDLGLSILAERHNVLTPGQDFGHYKIRDLLGRGGMGEVYLAEDTKLGRPVALKVLPADVASNEERIRRFIQEARAASALNHPNILTIHEIGETDGWRFIASEFVEGHTLRERIKGEQSLTLQDVMDITLQITAALNAAHKVRIIHRDIKPENIMLREDGLVKVLDFGLAKLIEAPDQNSATGFASTSPGMVMGTIAYMSPEQTRGKKTDARSDIWSLGVVLYEMLVGRLPFGGDTNSDIIAAILTTEPALPESETWMPESLWQIITKALRKNPDERYQAIRELADDLRGVFSDAEVAASGGFHTPTNFTLISGTDPVFLPTGEGLRHLQSQVISSRWSRYRVGFAIASVLVVVLAGGFGGFSLLKTSSMQPITTIAVLPFVNESGDPDFEYLTDGITETLIRNFSQIRGLSVKARSSSFQYKGKDVDPRTVGKEISAEAILIGRILKKDDQLTLSYELVDAKSGNVILSERYQRSQAELFQIQDDILRRVSGAIRGADAKPVPAYYAGNREAYELYLRGRYSANRRTVPDIKNAGIYYQKAIEIDRGFALAYSGLADSYHLLGDYGAMPRTESGPLAKAAALKAIEIDPDLAEAHTSLAESLVGSHEKEQEFQRAIELNPTYAPAYQLYAELLAGIGRFDEAKAAIHRAIELDPLSRICRNIDGRISIFAGRYDEGIAILKKNIDLEPTWGIDHDMLFHAYVAKGMYPEAVDAYVTAFSLLKSLTPSEEIKLREVFAKNGWEAFLTMRVRSFEKQAKHEYVRPLVLSELYAQLRENDKAFDYLHQSIEKQGKGIVRWVRYFPSFRNLRSDPRFDQFLLKFDPQ